VPLPADGRDATALPGLRAAPTDVELAEAGCETHTAQSSHSQTSELTENDILLNAANCCI